MNEEQFKLMEKLFEQVGGVMTTIKEMFEEEEKKLSNQSDGTKENMTRPLMQLSTCAGNLRSKIRKLLKYC